MSGTSSQPININEQKNSTLSKSEALAANNSVENRSLQSREMSMDVDKIQTSNLRSFSKNPFSETNLSQNVAKEINASWKTTEIIPGFLSLFIPQTNLRENKENRLQRKPIRVCSNDLKFSEKLFTRIVEILIPGTEERTNLNCQESVELDINDTRFVPHITAMKI